MPRNRVSDMDFDEVSTVDVPANQHGLIVLAKSASQEDTMPDFVDEEGNALDGQLMQDTETGDVFFQTADGEILDVDPDDFVDAYDGEAERELETVGKSAFLDQIDAAGQQYYGAMSEELAKALTDAGRDDVLAKAFAQQAQQLAVLQEQAEQATLIAKAAEEREQESLFISKAANDYSDLGVEPEVLGPVLNRMSKALSYDDCAVVASIFERQSEIFKQFGLPGGEGFINPLAEIEEFANSNSSELAKSYNGELGGRTELSKEQGVRAFFDVNPAAYDEYRRDRGR